MKQEIKLNREQVNKVRNYYKSAEIFLVNDSGWRFFRFKLLDGTFKNFCINNKEDFRKLLIKYTPIVTYYSSGCWLNSENIKGKIKTKTFPIKLYEDAIFDIDNDNLEEARQITLKLIEKIGLNPNYIIMTRRGFHVCYYKANKKELLEKVKDINFDKKCTENEYGVFSIPLTLNKAGRVNILLTYEQLKNCEISQLRVLQPQIYIYPDEGKESEKPEKANEEAVNQHSSRNLVSLETRSEIDEETTLTGSKESLFSFNNKVKPNIFVPILIYNKNLKKLKLEIERLVKQYDLGELFIFTNKEYVCFISLKVVEFRRLEKLLNNSRSITKLQWFKFNKIWFNISEFRPIGKLDYKTNKFYRVSNKHYQFLKDIGININQKINEFVGKVPLQIYNTKWEV